MPTPITAFLPRNQKGTYPAANLPSTATTIKSPPTSSIVQPAILRDEGADIDRRSYDDEKDGHEEVPQGDDRLLDLVGLRRAAEQQSGGEGPDDRGRPGHFGPQASPKASKRAKVVNMPGTARRPSHRQRRHEEPAHHERADEEAEGHPR